LFEAFFVDESQVDIFDAVLVAEGYEDLVKEGRPVAPERDIDGVVLDPVMRLGRPNKPACFSPFSCRQITEYVFLLPVNFIPWVGSVIFLFLIGYRAGPLMAWRYFQLRGFNREARKKFIKERRWWYAWFGTTAMLLQLVPILDMLFLFTSAAGSALLAARIETQRRIAEALLADEEPVQPLAPEYQDSDLV
jgi:hypothetical protein